jgi:hypothetical protein
MSVCILTLAMPSATARRTVGYLPIWLSQRAPTKMVRDGQRQSLVPLTKQYSRYLCVYLELYFSYPFCLIIDIRLNESYLK